MTSHFSTLLSACLFRHLVLMFAKPLINSRPIYPFCRQQKSKKARRKNSPFIHLPQTLFCHKQSLISLQTTLIHRRNKIKGLCKNIGGAHKGVLQEICKRRMKNRVCTTLHIFKKLVCLVFITMHDSHIVCFPFLMRFLPKRGQLGPYYTT